MDDFPHDTGSSGGTGGSEGGVNYHDPILEQEPRLHRLKRQLPWAGVAFAVALTIGLGLFVWGMESAQTLVVAAGVVVFVLGAGYFGYVTAALSVGARKAQERQAKERLAEVLRQRR